MKKLYTADNALEAQLLLGELEAAGLRGSVHDAAPDSNVWIVPTLVPRPAVYVLPEDYLAALDVLEVFLERSIAEVDGEPWQCRKCGEMIEPDFAACWNCGAERHETTDQTT